MLVRDLARAALLILLTAGCHRAPSPCPAGYVADDARTNAVMGALARSEEGRGLLARAPRNPRVCSGEPRFSVITTEGVILLDRRLDEGEAAARAGHLLLHLADGLPDPAPGDAGGCEAAVERALASEAQALALELRLRGDLGVVRPRVVFEFEGAFWAAPPASREALILDYLRTHPDGGPGIDALASGYAARCRGER